MPGDRFPAGVGAGPLENDAWGVLIARQACSTFANVHPLRELFFRLPPAARAGLTRLDLARWNLDILGTSFFRFVPQHGEKRTGGRREYLSIEPGLLGNVVPRNFHGSPCRTRHVGDRQALGGDQICGRNELRRGLMQEVAPPIRGLVMNPCYHDLRLAAPV